MSTQDAAEPRVAHDRHAVLLMGPTGAGKSELALQVAQHFPVEIVSVDSAQVYRGMDIGTAKPSAADRSTVPHHLLDLRDPTQTYSAGEFVIDAAAAMQEIWARGNVPLLVGGTMLYFHALTEGIAELPARDLALRATIDARGAREGWGALHQELAAVDPLAASRIHANDSQRIQRALEVHTITGHTITSLQSARVSAFADVNVMEFALAPANRCALHTKIAFRFAGMLEHGLLSEIQRLFERSDLSAEHPSMRAVGYRQLWRYLAGQNSLTEASELAIVATRQLAKRQLTWLRRRQSAQWLDAAHPDVAGQMVDALSKGGLPQVPSV